VEFVTDLVKHLAENGYVRAAPNEAAEESWTTHVLDSAVPFLVADTAWFRGANIPGKADRFMLYVGGLVAYRAKLDEVASRGYDGFDLSKERAGVSSSVS
jgi:cyclohexanone monooxygenase